MSYAYGPADADEAVRTLERSLELGINHWDTADMYGAGENERLLSRVLKTSREKVFLATKFGNVTDRSLTSHQDLVAANAGWIVDGTPEYIRKSCDWSLEKLGVETIDLYYQHRIDDRVPVEESIGAMKELVEAGKVRYLGISEASAETIRRANAVHPLAAVQMEYSLWTRDIEDDVIPVLRELGIALVPYSPLGRGFLTGAFAKTEDIADGDWRKTNPRFQGENFDANLVIVQRIQAIADARQVAAAQVALAWVLTKGEDFLPIPGTKRVKWLEQNADAIEIELTADEIASLEDFETSGTRYPEAMMQFTKR